jgi:Bacteriophage tail sheath protein
MPAPIKPRIFIEEIPRRLKAIEGVSTSTTAFIGVAASGPVNQPIKITSLMEYDDSFGGVSEASEMSYGIRQFFANGGNDAWALRVPDGQLQISANDLELFSGVKEPINLLCMPAITDPASLSAAAAYCESHRIFLIADTAKGASPSEIEAAVANSQMPKTEFGAAYYPWIKISDPLNANQPRLSAPSGGITGMYARMDLNRGVWKAPAGREASLTETTGLDHALTESEMTRLNSIGVSCLRSLPEVGVVVWGARTLAGGNQTGSEWKYVNIRRLAIFLEHSIDQGTQWAVFEPNDEQLWARIRASVDSFMLGMFRAGAFQGVTQEQAYYVHCGRETTTQNDIDQGVVNIIVGFAPLKPAEFVIIKILQLAGQSTNNDE